MKFGVLGNLVERPSYRRDAVTVLQKQVLLVSDKVIIVAPQKILRCNVQQQQSDHFMIAK